MGEGGPGQEAGHVRGLCQQLEEGESVVGEGEEPPRDPLLAAEELLAAPLLPGGQTGPTRPLHRQLHQPGVAESVHRVVKHVQQGVNNGA